MDRTATVHLRGTLVTGCAFCGHTQVIPTRSSSFAEGTEPSDGLKFYDWSRTDEFWEEPFAEDYNVFVAGAILSVTTDGFAEPLAPMFAEVGRRTVCVIPPFGETAYWVCGPCKKHLPEFIRSELPPVDIYV